MGDGRRWTAPRRGRTAPAGDLIMRNPRRDLYGGWPDSATVAWLETATTEITAGIAEGAHRPLDVRVFVREAARGR